MPDANLKHSVVKAAHAAKRASQEMARLGASERTQALHHISEAIRDTSQVIAEANATDMAHARERGLSEAMLDRLSLDAGGIDGIATAVVNVAALPEVVGRVDHCETRPNGLIVERVRIPLGVVAIIYESRPNVTTDAAALCLKAGNACILRGGSEAFESNQALGAAIKMGLRASPVPENAVQVFDTTDRADLNVLLEQDSTIDLVIPRGGEGLIRFVTENSRIPVLQHYKGVCHVYVDGDADPAMALRICHNAKVQRPGVCNAAETLLIDRRIAKTFTAELCRKLIADGVEVRGDRATLDLCKLAGIESGKLVAATPNDWSEEYLSLCVSIREVDGVGGAIRHIQEYGSNHTEAIVTDSDTTANRFVAEVQSSTVTVNASTRFADGGELGLGAEIGISTTKLHAYGPMGHEGLTTTRFVVRGTGQIHE